MKDKKDYFKLKDEVKKELEKARESKIVIIDEQIAYKILKSIEDLSNKVQKIIDNKGE